MWAQKLVAPRRLETVDVPAPDEAALADGDVIVEMQAGAICGSDVPLFAGRLAANRVYSVEEGFGRAGCPMHEMVGVVIASRSDLEVGQRVVGWAREQNALCERVVAHASSLWPLRNDGLRPVQETMIQPLACIIHALGRLGTVADQVVAVIGLGPAGLLFTHVLHSLGAKRVIGVDPVDRSDIADVFGLDDAVCMTSDRWLYWVDASERPAVIVEAVGHQVGSLNDAINAVASEGTVFYFGIADDAVYPIHMKAVQRKNLTIVSGNTPIQYRRPVLDKAMSYLAQYPELPSQYFTHVFNVTAAQEAFELASRPHKDHIKVGLQW
jgi:L-iditol 2-dehydrogenase